MEPGGFSQIQGLSAFGKSVARAIFLGGSRQLLPSVFPAWLSAMKTAGVILALLLHFCRTYIYFYIFFPWDWVQTNWGRMFCAGLVPPKDGSSPGGSSPGRNVRDINGNKEENPSGMEEKSKLGTPWVVITKKGFGRRNLDPLTLNPPL